MKRAFGLVCLVVAAGAGAMPCFGQRQPVLPQIHEPHPYYYRELYLPQLTSGPSSLCWGPTSEELIYSMAGSLWRQRLGTNDAKQLTDGPGYDYQPDWSPDGKAVVYVSYQRDAMELWLLDLRSGQTRQLTSSGAVNVEPRWSPDGKKLVWVSTEYNGRFHVFVGEVTESALHNVVRMTGETKSSLPRYYYSEFDMEINPVWTRDGKEILFVSNRGHIHGTGGFWRMKASPRAGAREIHSEETSWKARPDFSPDGSRMVYSSYLGRQWHNLWVMPANGGDAFPITYGDWDETNVRWSPDGKLLAFISNKLSNTVIHWQDFQGEKNEAGDIELPNREYLREHFPLRYAVDADPSRVSVTDQDGRSYVPEDGLIFADDGFDRRERASERHYFYPRLEKGGRGIMVPRGQYVVEISRGFEKPPFRDEVQVPEPETESDWTNPPSIDFKPILGGKWVPGDLHVHTNYGGTYKNNDRTIADIAAAEGVAVTNQLTVNKEQRIPDVAAQKRENDGLGSTSTQNSNWIILGQEYHTSYWGHRGLLDLGQDLILPGYAGYPNTAASSLYPMNADVYDMAHGRGALVGAVHPFDEVPNPFAMPAQKITDELPVDVALGKLDYIEIVGFSDHKSTAEVWYKLLNLGFTLSAGGGTDATTDYAAPIRGQIGFDRVYVWTLDWPTTIELWTEGIKRGRTFATNGPLVDFTLGDEMLGGTLKLDVAQAAVPFRARLRSIVPVDHLELVCNGKVVRDLRLSGAQDSADVSGTIPLSESGWCVLRSWSEKAVYPVMDNYEYATTSPIYVTIGGKRAYRREDAEYFEAWIDRTIEITETYPDWNSAKEKEYVIGRLREARAVYERMR